VENRAEYEALKRLNKNCDGYQSAWDRSWEQLRCDVDPFGHFTDDQVSAHFFGEGDDDYHPYYLGPFLAGALETWNELESGVTQRSCARGAGRSCSDIQCALYCPGCGDRSSVGARPEGCRYARAG
jgi:hypothetical protein